MAFITARYQLLQAELKPLQVTLVAVSKKKPVADILEAYHIGQRDFGENYVQELVEKAAALPQDIRWHFIGHLQGNKVKQIAPFVHLIHGVDSEKLLREIDKQGEKAGNKISCLLQVHIANEETKFGFSPSEVYEIMPGDYHSTNICGLMGMATYTSDIAQVKNEFKTLHKLYLELQQKHNGFEVLSMGMSGDYKEAIEEGSNMVRIGSMLFGDRL